MNANDYTMWISGCLFSFRLRNKHMLVDCSLWCWCLRLWDKYMMVNCWNYYEMLVDISSRLLAYSLEIYFVKLKWLLKFQFLYLCFFSYEHLCALSDFIWAYICAFNDFSPNFDSSSFYQLPHLVIIIHMVVKLMSQTRPDTVGMG